MLRQP